MSGNAVKTPPGLSGGLEVQTRGPGGGIGGVAPDDKLTPYSAIHAKHGPHSRGLFHARAQGVLRV